MDPERHLAKLVEDAVQSFHDAPELGPVLAELAGDRGLRCT
jgi:hypothetical protein